MQTRPLVANEIPYQFTLRLTADDSLATGKSPDIQISINGGAFFTPANSVVEVGNGLYTILIDGSDLNTLGEVWAFITATDCKDQLIYAFDVTLTDFNLNDINPAIVWDELTSGHGNAGSFGKYLKQELISQVPTYVWEADAAAYPDPTVMGGALTTMPANVWAYVLEGTKSAAWFMRVFLAALTGKVTGVTTDHPLFKGLDGTTTRIDTTTSADGRDVPTLDGD